MTFTNVSIQHRVNCCIVNSANIANAVQTNDMCLDAIDQEATVYPQMKISCPKAV